MEIIMVNIVWVLVCLVGVFFFMGEYWYVSAILTIIAFIFVLKFYKYNPLKARKSRKKAWDRLKKIQQAPKFSANLIDSYVQLSGKIISSNKHVLPELACSCVFYVHKVSATWQTRSKKPSSGMDTHKKILFDEESPSPVIKVGTEAQEVLVNLELFKAQLNRRLKVESDDSETCPSICKDKDLAKYKTYTSELRYCEQGDDVIVVGRLTDRHGKLEIIPAEHSNLPAFFCVGSMDSITQHYKNIVRKQYRMPVSLWFWLVVFLIQFIFVVSTGVGIAY